MPAMPTVVVEIAFNATYSTPAASRVWTDVSGYVSLDSGVVISYGRQDEMSQADANTLSLTLDNRDGRFTPGLASSPYYPNVKIGRPIRVTTTPSDGAASTRFVGFIEEWPVSFPGSDARSWVLITANSRIARLGLDRPVRSILSEVMVPDGPLAYYTFGEAAGASVGADTSGNNGPSLVTYGAGNAPSFGSPDGPFTDGLTAATFGTESCGMQAYPLNLGSGIVTMEFFLYYTAGGKATVLELADDNSNAFRFVADGTTSGIYFTRVANPGTGLQVEYNLDNSYVGKVTHFVLVHDGVQTIKQYVNGVYLGSSGSSVTAKSWGNLTTLRLFPPSINRGGSGSFTVAHVAVYAGEPTAAQVSAHAAAGLSGFAGEIGNSRFNRYLDWAAVPSTERAIDAASIVEMGHEDTNGKQVLELLRDLETAEQGVIFDSRDGRLRFQPRQTRYTKTPDITLSMTSQQVGDDYAPKLDRSNLINRVEASNPTGTVQVIYDDPNSQAEYGMAATSISTMANSSQEPFSLATWLVNSYSTPKMRAGSVTVDVALQSGGSPSGSACLGVDISSVIRITGLPSQLGGGSIDYFVEGYTENIGANTYTITYNLSPSSPRLMTLILDDASRGILNTNLTGI